MPLRNPNSLRPSAGLPALTRSARALPAILAWLVFLCAVPARAHVGSPDVYAEGDAGPYKLFVTIRPPMVIPGVAQVEVRTSAPRLDGIRMAPMPLTGDASRHPPVADLMRHSPEDPEFYSGSLWIMSSGSWQVRFQVSGKQGAGELSIPVAATPIATLKMQPWMGAGLALLGLFLVLGMAGIAGAAVRDAQLAPGSLPPGGQRLRARWVTAAAAAVLLLAVWLGGRWWNAEAAGYANNVYKPLAMQAVLTPGNVLDLKLSNPSTGPAGWMHLRKLDDFILDHDHLMHLYMIREPQMDVVFHLHPTFAPSGDFLLNLPQMPAGSYRLYADVVHADGFPETLVTSIGLPAIQGRPLAGDDAEGTAPPLSQASEEQTAFRLPDGYMMVWARPPVLRARRPELFAFYLLDPQGKPPADMALYMGMLGHAAFVRSDGAVFAHIHPSGSPAMAAMMLARQSDGSMNGMSMPMSGDPGRLPNRVTFPYGFPTPGKYRIFVQMKHGDTIETGAFDADVPR
ncbi:MAG TPA: hypothetical protein VGR96_05225 [Acidobacteriaceae bacterium]|nr:hypothetical protein [Acidobacteriaceae bacterium]